MNVDIRQHIINNFKDSPKEEIKDSIISSIEAKEEITLPGLGVFFEILWNQSNNDDKDKIIDTLSKSF